MKLHKNSNLYYINYQPSGREIHAGSAMAIRRGTQHNKLPKYEKIHIQATNSIENWDGNLII
jgi:hypothetical protein